MLNLMKCAGLLALVMATSVLAQEIPAPGTYRAYDTRDALRRSPLLDCTVSGSGRSLTITGAVFPLRCMGQAARRINWQARFLRTASCGEQQFYIYVNGRVVAWLGLSPIRDTQRRILCWRVRLNDWTPVYHSQRWFRR